MFLSPRRELNPQPSDLRWDALMLPGLRWQREGWRSEGCRFNSRLRLRNIFQSLQFKLQKQFTIKLPNCKSIQYTSVKDIFQGTVKQEGAAHSQSHIHQNGLRQNLTIMMENHLLSYTTRCTNDLWLPETSRKTSGKEWRMLQQDVCCGYTHR